jgi:4-amino-4-deoxy-L-arabinose transferase-like glycosyltransferase
MRTWFLIHLTVFGVAFALRLWLAASFVGLSAPPKGEANPDQLDYESFAYHVSAGDGFVLEPGKPSACRPPGTSFVLLPVYELFGRSYLLGRIWFCLLSAACCPIAGWMAHRLLGRWTGVLAAGWLAVYPGHAYYAVHFLSETPTTLVTVAAVALHVGASRRPAGWLDLFAGLTWGLGILVRPNLAVAAGLAAVIALMTRSISWRSRIAKAGLVAAATAGVVGPWVARNAIVMGKPALCTVVGGYTFWGSHNPRVADTPNLVGYWVPASSLMDDEHPLTGGEIEREAQAWEYGKEFVRAHPDRLPAMESHALLRVAWAYPEAENRAADLGFRVGWIASLPFVLIGLARMTRRAPVATCYLLTPLATVLVTAMVFYGCGRFRDGAAPVLAVFAAAGMGAAIEWVFAKVVGKGQ